MKSLRLRDSKLAVVYGDGQDWILQHAAEEFARYVKGITGQEVKVLTDAEDLEEYDNLVLIGDETTNRIVMNLVRGKDASYFKVQYGVDNFIIRSLVKDRKNYLILAGGTGGSTLYAVYDYFERFCNVGYFWDGDHIPKSEEIPFFEIDVYEEPVFKWRGVRYFCHWGLKRFHSLQWNIEDWQREMDWLVKNKFNMFHFEGGIPQDDLYQLAFPEVEYPPPGRSKYDVVYGHPGVKPEDRDVSQNYFPGTWVVPLQYGRKLRQNVIEYARKRGLKYVNEGGSICVPPEYAEKHPEQHFVRDTKQYLSITIDPYYPEGWEFIKKAIKKAIELYGTDHIYCGLPVLGEVNYGAEKGYDVLEFKKFVLKKLGKIYHEIDPVGIFNLQGWDFGCQTWGPRVNDIREAVQLLSPELSYIEDLWCDYDARETYKEWGFFDGRPWGMAILHSLAMADDLHGDREFIINRVKETLSDPNSGKFIGLGYLPELHHYDTMYAQLMAKLAWNPKNVTLESFLQNYVLRRYGREASANMLKSMRALCEATKLYQWGKTGNWASGEHKRYYCTLFTGRLFHDDDSAGKAVHFDKIAEKGSRHFKEALGYALLENERLKDCRMYETDVVDIARSLLGDLIGLHLGRIYLAYEGATTLFRRGQDAKLFIEWFEEEARVVKELIQALQDLLSTREDFSLEKTIEETMRVEGVNPIAPDIIKSNQETPYNRSQVYELVSKVYKRDVDAYIDLLRRRLGARSPEFASVEDPEFKAKLNQHHREYLEQPLHVEKTFRGNALDAVQKVYQLAGELIPPIMVTMEHVASASRQSQEEATIRITVDSQIPNVSGDIVLANPMMGFVSEPHMYSIGLTLGRWQTVLSIDAKLGLGRNVIMAFITYNGKKFMASDVLSP